MDNLPVLEETTNSDNAVNNLPVWEEISTKEEPSADLPVWGEVTDTEVKETPGDNMFWTPVGDAPATEDSFVKIPFNSDSSVFDFPNLNN